MILNLNGEVVIYYLSLLLFFLFDFHITSELVMKMAAYIDIILCLDDVNEK